MKCKEQTSKNLHQLILFQKQEISGTQFTYKTRVLTGKRFQVDRRIPLSTPNYFIDLTKYDVWNFTFVTAADDQHFEESKDAIAGFQKVFPGYRFVYYDLGLNPEDAQQVGLNFAIRLCHNLPYYLT